MTFVPDPVELARIAATLIAGDLEGAHDITTVLNLPDRSGVVDAVRLGLEIMEEADKVAGDLRMAQELAIDQQAMEEQRRADEAWSKRQDEIRRKLEAGQPIRLAPRERP